MQSQHSFKRGVSQCFHSTLANHRMRMSSQHSIHSPANWKPIAQAPTTTTITLRCCTLHNGPAEANLNVPRNLQLTNCEWIQILSSIHTFWTTNLLSCAAKSDHVKTQNWVPQSPSQHCTNSSKDTVTHSETANQHPTTKRTHCTKQHATLLAAKRSVVTSDATETKLHLHNSKYKYKNCTSMQAHNKRPIKRLQFPNNQPKLLHQTTHN